MEAAQPRDGYLELAYKTVRTLLDHLPARPFAVRLPDGSTFPPEPPTPSPPFTLVINQPAALRRMFLPPSELAMGESYIFGEYDIEGDITAAFGFMDELEWPRLSLRTLWQLARQLWKLERDGRKRTAVQETAAPQDEASFAAYQPEGTFRSYKRDLHSIQFHYDISNAFYKLFLGERMVYSCGYFDDPDNDLDTAQQRKLDILCRRLNIQPGQRLLDIGCGWGGLLMHAASAYGAYAHGITLSDAQVQEATARIKAANLSDRCHVDTIHYEQIETAEPFDKIASIGMAEHVGKAHFAGYFAKAYDLLKPGGLFLIEIGVGQISRRHIGRGWMDRLGKGRTAFMEKYGFPDGRLVDILTILEEAEQAGFETRHLENWREHYVLTFRHWIKRLRENKEAAIKEVGHAAYRAWLLQFTAFIHLLRRGYLYNYHILLAKPTRSGRVSNALSL